MKEILGNINKYYTEKIIQKGPSPEGVDWKDEDSQFIRFAQLLRIIKDNDDRFSLNDLGCGYGKLVEFMRMKGFADFKYAGYDLSEEMIMHAHNLYGLFENCVFHKIDDSSGLQTADYSVASGIFNVRMGHAEEEWLEYILATLRYMARFSNKGFAFNCLTSYSDRERMKEYLYYADPGFFFDYCKKQFARNVALLHDYDLYEFTVLVRKG